MFDVALETALQLVQFYEANYPEFLRRVFVINAPKIFSLLYSMIKPFMHEKTKNKVQIYSYDAAQWKAALLEDIDPQELPVCYGGTKTDPDGNPNCITMASLSSRLSLSLSPTVSLRNSKHFRSIWEEKFRDPII